MSDTDKFVIRERTNCTQNFIGKEVEISKRNINKMDVKNNCEETKRRQNQFF